MFASFGEVCDFVVNFAERDGCVVLRTNRLFVGDACSAHVVR